ncbi:hypothetical protein SAMN04489835_1851 [Mycolicibacterium rutilum]|uniref:Uncharacterized protein n=1 Tax=Mycolicibacterium rutilum TaxID=370526 RepID=A0A1H6JKM4_MYCRU|nr:hypothetical protein [Mycolicibacterium rutilum]SEH59716.1 hypothetical protein SAMN04489835_1851 [Mycolicibacterium rutilum]
MRRLDRRWWIAIGVVVVAIVALVYTQLQKPPAECGPVRDLLEFNSEQGDLIREKGEGEEGLPTAADELAYRQWADGLAERARKIDAPELRFTAIDAADLAGAFVRKLPELRAEADAQAPGAPTPQIVYEMSALDDQLQRRLSELATACDA